MANSTLEVLYPTGTTALQVPANTETATAESGLPALNRPDLQGHDAFFESGVPTSPQDDGDREHGLLAKQASEALDAPVLETDWSVQGSSAMLS